MTLEKPPFRSYTLDSDRLDPLETGKVFTVRLNAKEYANLKRDMVDLTIKSESTALKFLAEVGRNVLHSTFGRDKLRWIFSPKRIKPVVEGEN